MKNFIIFSLLLAVLASTAQTQPHTDTLSVFFDIGKSAVDAANAKSLDKLINDKNITDISIIGYTDFLGGVQYNQLLSEKRSENVCKYLINKGISEKKIRLSIGKGIHPNSKEENRKEMSDKGIQAHRMVQVVYSIKLQDSTPKESLPDENIVVGNSIILENIIFYGNSDKFLPESYPALKELLDVMLKYATLKIEIQGHICCEGRDPSEFTGKPLSISRAEAVYNYLIDKGIDSTRMTYKGFGSTRKRFPLEQNLYEQTMNRRVEILILEK